MIWLRTLPQTLVAHLELGLRSRMRDPADRSSVQYLTQRNMHINIRLPLLGVPSQSST
jgi:hypothetical protein